MTYAILIVFSCQRSASAAGSLKYRHIPSLAVMKREFLFVLLLASLLQMPGLGLAQSTDDCIRSLDYTNGAQSAETGHTLSPAGSMVAVRFTPTQKSTLIGIRYFIVGKPESFNVRLFDSDRRLLPDKWTSSPKWPFNPKEHGWISIDVSEASLRFESDFYIAAEFLRTITSYADIPGPVIGSVDGNEQGRSYDIYYHLGEYDWRPDASVPAYVVDHTYMIVATMATSPGLIVNSPVEGSTGAGCYNLGDEVQVSTPAVVDEGPGVRQVFTGWSGDATGTEPSTIVKINKFVTTVNANYKVQYVLAVNSTVPVKGGGWYDEDTNAKLTVPGSNVPIPGLLGLLGARAEFVRWEGDASGNASSVTIKMNIPHSVKAVWTFDYSGLYVTIPVLAAAISIGAFLVLRRTRSQKPLERSFCINCSKEMRKGTQFCTNCGTSRYMTLSGDAGHKIQ